MILQQGMGHALTEVPEILWHYSLCEIVIISIEILSMPENQEARHFSDPSVCVRNNMFIFHENWLLFLSNKD